jgi:hypothetical protein
MPDQKQELGAEPVAPIREAEAAAGIAKANYYSLLLETPSWRAARADIEDCRDAIRRLSAALLAARQAGREEERRAAGWQPIETAPRDGAFVLIACDEVYVARYDAENDLWYFPVDGCAIDPTHWMPLPAPPADHLPAQREEGVASGYSKADFEQALQAAMEDGEDEIVLVALRMAAQREEGGK